MLPRELSSVTIIDPRTRMIIGSIPSGEEKSHMMVISKNGRFAYTANAAADTVSVLDLTHRKLIKKIVIAPKTQRIAISNDDSMVFTSDQTKTFEVVRSIRVGEKPQEVLAFRPDGTLVYVSSFNGHDVRVIDLASWEVVATIEVGQKADGMGWVGD